MPWNDEHSSFSLNSARTSQTSPAGILPGSVLWWPYKRSAHWSGTDHHARTEPPPGSGVVPVRMLPPGDAPRNPGKAMETPRGSSAEPVAQPLADAEGGAANGGYVLCGSRLYYSRDTNSLKAQTSLVAGARQYLSVKMGSGTCRESVVAVDRGDLTPPLPGCRVVGGEAALRRGDTRASCRTPPGF